MTKMFEVCYSGSWPELGTRPVLGLTDWWFGTKTIYYHFVLNTRVLSQFLFSLKALSFFFLLHIVESSWEAIQEQRAEEREKREQGEEERNQRDLDMPKRTDHKTQK